MTKELVTELAENEFNNFIKDSKAKLVVVDFFAEWCMPCVMMAPVIESLAEENKEVKFGKINVDDAPELSEQYEISSIPCIILFKDGKVADRVIGAVGEQVLQSRISKVL